MLKREPGADAVQAKLTEAAITAVNVAEILTKVSDWNLDANAYLKNLIALPMEFVDFGLALAVIAGRLRAATRGFGLSLGDRACLALAMERNCAVLTADRNWAKLNLGIPIQLIR